METSFLFILMDQMRGTRKYNLELINERGWFSESRSSIGCSNVFGKKILHMFHVKKQTKFS